MQDAYDGKRKCALVTGANSGIGLATAKGLYLQGFHVVLACRSVSKAGAALEEIRTSSNSSGKHAPGSLEIMEADLNDLASVRDLATRYCASGKPLNVLVNNAGLNTIGMDPRSRTAQGFELCFGVNYLAHYLLTELLSDLLVATGNKFGTARVVNLSSVTHYQGRTDYDFLATNPRGKSYASSKLALTLYTAELQRKFAGTKVSAVAVNPGAVRSDIWRTLPWYLALIAKPIFFLLFLSIDQGALPSLAAATWSDEQLYSGGYVSPLNIGRALVYLQPYPVQLWLGKYRWISELLGPSVGARHAKPLEIATDPAAAAALVKLSSTLTREFTKR